MEYKALTHINIPFVEERYAPGEMIPRSSFEEAYSRAGNVILHTPGDENATPVPTADEVIEDLIKWGSLSDDPEAPLHPSAIIPDPNRLSLTSLQAQAEALIAELREAGHPVPKELTELASMPDKKLAAAEEALSDDRIA